MATILRFPSRSRPRTYDDAVREQGDIRTISAMNAKPLPCDWIDPTGFRERLNAIEADERRDRWAMRWNRRVTALCIVAFYAAVFAVSFLIGKTL